MLTLKKYFSLTSSYPVFSGGIKKKSLSSVVFVVWDTSVKCPVTKVVIYLALMTPLVLGLVVVFLVFFSALFGELPYNFFL